jgi:hypothetical protein
MNVGSGGGAAAVASGPSAAAGGAAPEEAKAEEAKPEGKDLVLPYCHCIEANNMFREGRVGRGHGFRSFRLRDFRIFLSVFTMHGSGLSSFGAMFAGTSCFHRMSKLI